MKISFTRSRLQSHEGELRSTLLGLPTLSWPVVSAWPNLHGLCRCWEKSSCAAILTISQWESCAYRPPPSCHDHSPGLGKCECRRRQEKLGWTLFRKKKKNKKERENEKGSVRCWNRQEKFRQEDRKSEKYLRRKLTNTWVRLVHIGAWVFMTGPLPLEVQEQGHFHCSKCFVWQLCPPCFHFTTNAKTHLRLVNICLSCSKLVMAGLKHTKDVLQINLDSQTKHCMWSIRSIHTCNVLRCVPCWQIVSAQLEISGAINLCRLEIGNNSAVHAFPCNHHASPVIAQRRMKLLQRISMWINLNGFHTVY